MYEIIKKSFSKYNLSRYFNKDKPENLIYCNFINGISGERFYD